MNNNIQTETPDKGIIQIQENYEDEYWSKKYAVSSEELKRTGNKVGISARIIEALTRKHSFDLSPGELR